MSHLGPRSRFHSSEIALAKDSKESLAWLLCFVQATATKALSDPLLLQCLSAADAMAEGDKVGIGVGCGSQRPGLCQTFKPYGHWSHARSVALLVSHVSGQKNVWADELSRDKQLQLGLQTS